MFGEDRLHQVLKNTRGLAGGEISDQILNAVQTHSGRSVFEDDVCIVTIEAR
jgi:serine phosphatase RsbU (regulator of sigma subunit)